MCDGLLSSGLNPLYEGGMDDEFLQAPIGVFGARADAVIKDSDIKSDYLGSSKVGGSG